MLAKAIQDHHPGVPGLKATTFEQQSKPNSNALKPMPPTALNSTILPWPSSKNLLKRTVSQASGVSSQYASQEKRANTRPVIDQTRPVERVGKLHDAVFFDENDFEDDADIDLDDDSPSTVNTATMSREPSTTSSKTLLPSPISEMPVTPRTLASSAPLPWSSSPPSHHQIPPPEPVVAATTESTRNPTKRRTLPWTEEEKRQNLVAAGPVHSRKRKRDMADNSKNLLGQGIPESVAENITMQKEHALVAQASGSTPLPKNKSISLYPWNQTASAVKEEQKKLREGHRKLAKDSGGSRFPKANNKKKRESVARVFLSDEQKSVLDLVAEQKKSVFFTGSAGTGKSVLLRETIKVLRDKYKREPDRVAVTASTGLAACNVGGVTLHSFAGIGLGKEPVPDLVRKIKRNQKAKNRWIRTKVLIVDEISMVDGDLFDKLESIARAIRNNGRPFGGIQLVITGDFFQLPPVPDYGQIAKFSFDAATWQTSIEHTIGLTQVFRQKDPVFANMLNEMRLGKLTPKSIDAFRQLNRPLNFDDDFQATELFPTRIEVDNANSARMRNLAGTEVEFRAVDGGTLTDVSQRTKLLANCMAPPSIALKRGAQVMLIKNIDDTLVNGSVGKVIAFMDEKTFDIYHEDEDEFQAVETMELDNDEMTQSRKRLKALIHKNSLISETRQRWPLVRFSVADGTTRDLLCQQESWKIELPNGEVQASRLQIPLILAWALSIHKAQGQTLERVKVDLGKIFEKGQAYVALSRATSQEGLQISRFDPKKVMAHERVKTFYIGLYSASMAVSSKGPEKQKQVMAKDFKSGYVNTEFVNEADDDEMEQMRALG